MRGNWPQAAVSRSADRSRPAVRASGPGSRVHGHPADGSVQGTDLGRICAGQRNAARTGGRRSVTAGSAYVGSNPTPATTCETGPLAADKRLCGLFLLCPVVCRLVALRTVVVSELSGSTCAAPVAGRCGRDGHGGGSTGRGRRVPGRGLHAEAGNDFKVSRASAEYVRPLWESIGTIVMGRHLFDLTYSRGGSAAGGRPCSRGLSPAQARGLAPRGVVPFSCGTRKAETVDVGGERLGGRRVAVSAAGGW